MKPKFFMMVGISGSGKSQAAKFLSTINNAKIFSSDDIRKEIYGDENEQKNPQKVFEILHKRVKNSLINGESCIYDATNLIMKRRKSFLDSIKSIDCERICIVVPTVFEKCIEQDKKRERTVGKQVIERQRRQFQTPFFYEGWDEILIYNDSHKKEIGVIYFEGILLELMDIDHDNPHHDYTIGKHMLAAEEYCFERVEFARNKIMDDSTSQEDVDFYFKELTKWLLCGQVMRYHDIGKFDTKTFLNAKGEKSDIAHYYDHQNVFAYEIISHIGGGRITPIKDIFNQEEESLEWWLIVSVLSCWHMEPFFKPRDSKSWKKFINIIGNQMGELLIYMNRSDINSH